MILRSLSWIEHRLRPPEGWLPLLLLVAIILTLTMAVVDVGWVPQDAVVFVTGLTGLAFAILLASRTEAGQRTVGPLLAWLLISAYGFMVTIIWLGQLAPPLNVMSAGWASSSSHIRQNWALLIDRIGGWLTVILDGGRSEETVVFALGLGLLAWFLAAYAGWSTLRHHRPWATVTLLTLALAINNYFGRAELWTLPVFVGLMVALVAVVHYVDREADWSRRRMDYSTEIRLELLAYSGVIALVLFLVSSALPVVNIRAISNAVRNQPAVQRAEETLERVFAGVRRLGQAPSKAPSPMEGA